MILSLGTTQAHSGWLPKLCGMEMTKRMLQTLKGCVCDRPPFWFMRQAGRYLPEYQRLREREPDFLRFCYTPELAVEATMQPLRRFRPDAAILFSDILVVADALGRAVRFVEGQGPVLEALREDQEIGRLRVDVIGKFLDPVFQTVRVISEALPDDVALIGFAAAPWTLALYMVEGRGGTDGAHARAWALRNPSAFQALIAVIVEATSEYLSRQVEAGADVLQLFDSWAGLLSVQEFRRWVIAPTTEIVSRLRARHPEVPVIGFPRGAGLLYEEYLRETGVAAVGMDSAVPVEWAKEHLQVRRPVQGNLDNQVLRVGGPQLDEETDRLLSILGHGPFVFNLGHGILPDTPAEHVGRVADRVRAFRSDSAAR